MVFPAGFLLTLLLVGAAAAEECITGFSVVAPELAVPGKTTAVFITLNSATAPPPPLNVTLRLLPESQQITPGYDTTGVPIVETTQEINGHGIVPLELPTEATGSCTLQVLVDCGSGGSCEPQSQSQLRIAGPVRDVIIRPAKRTYRPGETLSFWVLALDHDLQVAAGAIGCVSVKDPQGTKVAVWDQVALDEGVKSFRLRLGERATWGRWLAYVEVEGTGFAAAVEVAPGAGGAAGAAARRAAADADAAALAVAEEHYVELRFGAEMRRRYKPGLPFAGKVEAMSTEKSVRVRVKVYDNTTSIYSQDIEISNGEGTFVVPAILADSDIIALQAELVSVESKEIESHYVLAREPIRKWNSSSDCYLLIEGVEHTLQPEEEAHVTILSTCPCERDLHYAITTDGQITEWAQRRYEDPPAPSPTTANSGAVCKLNFSFTVRSVMAPVSQLLVYYITPQGEPVSDVISFDVKLLNKAVYVNLEEREWWLPGQSLDLEVVAEPSSLVCLLGGKTEGGGDIRFDPTISEARPPGSSASAVAGGVDFLTAGVSLFQRRCARRAGGGPPALAYRQRGEGAGPAARPRRPPERLVGGASTDKLWMWRCFNYSSETASAGLTITAPDAAGKWSLWALTVSRGGLRFSAPVQVQVFRPLQVEFHLPASLRVRETLEVDIKIENNINSCMDVTALLALSEGAQFLSNGLLYVTERLRLGPHGATSLVVRLLVTTPGLKNMTVEVNGYTSSTCEGLEHTNNTTLSGAVVHSATVNVYPEGIVKTDTESAYFCANENLVISTAENYKYEWIQAPRNHESIIIEMKTTRTKSLGPLHVALSESKARSEKMYRVTVGDADNSISFIGRGKHGYGIQLVSASTPGILSADEWRTFWITWSGSTIAFGKGSKPSNGTLLAWKMDKKIKIGQIGFASSWGALAEFRIWNFNEESGFSQVLHLDTPRGVVPGSERGELAVAGGLALPVSQRTEGGGLAGALAQLAPLLLARIPHFSSTNRTSRTNTVALDGLASSIQTLLSFRKADASFSEHPMAGSARATAAALAALAAAQPRLAVDPDVVRRAKRWLQLRQEDDGRFAPLPADAAPLPRSEWSCPTRGNLTSDAIHLENVVEITAETVIALYEIGIETDADSDTLQKAKIFLENSLPNVQSPETVAAVTLALVLVRSATAAWAIEKLRNASTTEDGEFGWPHYLPKKDAADWLYESEAGKTLKVPLAATAEDYKASLYALSTFCLIGDLKAAESVVRYLFYRSNILDKHNELLYPAIKAFSQYDSLAKDRHRALTVSLATSGMELTDTLELTSDKPAQIMYLPSLPTKVFVYATGAGCATIQGKTTYSTYSAKSKTPLLDLWSGVVEEIQPDRSSIEEIEGKLPMLKIKTCFKWKGSKPSTVLRLEVSLFSGYELTTTPPQLINPTSDMAEMQHSYHANNLWFIFANISTSCPICIQYSARSVYVITSLRPAYARVYPAAREDLAAETFFHATHKSSLLHAVTADDMITWFGSTNTTNSEDILYSEGCKMKTTTTTKELLNNENSTESSESDVENSTETSLKLMVIEETTYTINVDGEADTTNDIDSTTEIETSTMEFTTDAISPSSDDRIEENIIPHEDHVVALTKPISSTQQPSSTTETNTQNKTSKNASGDINISNTVNETKLANNITLQNDDKMIASTVSDEHKTTHKVAYRLKFVNKEQIHDIPTNFERKEVTTEEVITFAPEVKNNQYVLLNKKQLWEILKEVVNNDFKKTVNTKMLRGLT